MNFLRKTTLVTALVLSGCGIYNEITVNTPANTDLTGFTTFAWLPDQRDTVNSPYNNEVIRNNIRNCIGRKLSDRGYKPELDTPDVVLQLVIDNKLSTKNIVSPARPPYFYYNKYYYGSDYFTPYTINYYYKPGRLLYCSTLGYCVSEISYMEGSITLNVISVKDGKLVWSCTAKGDIYDPSYIKESIHPAVLRIMKHYPVKAIVKRRKKEIRFAPDLVKSQKSSVKS